MLTNNKPKPLRWGDIYAIVKEYKPPPDSLELRNSFIETCMLDQDGNPVKQHGIHRAIQRAFYEWEYGLFDDKMVLEGGWHRGLATAPFNTGKSQQGPVGLGTYLQTRKPELMQLIITGDDKLAKKRVLAIRDMVASPEYRYWCKDHNFTPLEFDKKDTGGSEQVFFKSKNRTGNPSIECYSVLSRNTGQRCFVLWLDDVCGPQDRTSRAYREEVFSRVTQNWNKRCHLSGFIYGIRTPWHPKDANSRLLASEQWNHLVIRVREDKDGYDLEEYRVIKTDASKST